jgi:hypothetical protein
MISRTSLFGIEMVIVRARKEPLVIDRATSAASSLDDAHCQRPAGVVAPPVTDSEAPSVHAADDDAEVREFIGMSKRPHNASPELPQCIYMTNG